MKKQNLNGLRFGMLLVTKQGKHKNGKIHWECICDCGNKTNVMSSKLKSGWTKSCGCYRAINAKNNHTKHALYSTSFYHSWQNLKSRCNNKNGKEYHRYGGRGITYDPRWNEFLEFKKDMYQSYVFAKKKYRKESKRKNNTMTIERIDNNGDYCKENCCWILLIMQAQNTQNLKRFLAINPKGIKFITNNQTIFSNQHNLCRTSINLCLNKKQKEHKGWRFYYLHIKQKMVLLN